MQACPPLAWAAQGDLEQLAVAAPAGPPLLAALPCSVLTAVLPGVVGLVPAPGLLWEGLDSNQAGDPAALCSGLLGSLSLGADPSAQLATSTQLHGSGQAPVTATQLATSGLADLGAQESLVQEVAAVAALQGRDGEVLELGAPVVLPPRGHPGEWLQALDEAARAALQQQARHALGSLPTLQVRWQTCGLQADMQRWQPAQLPGYPALQPCHWCGWWSCTCVCGMSEAMPWEPGHSSRLHHPQSVPTCLLCRGGLQVEVWAGRYCCQALLLVDAVVWTAALGNAVAGLSSGSSPQALRALCDAASLRLEALAKALRGGSSVAGGTTWGAQGTSSASGGGPSPLTLPHQGSAGQGWVGPSAQEQEAATDAVPTAACGADTSPRSPKAKRSQAVPSSSRPGQDHISRRADQRPGSPASPGPLAAGAGTTSFKAARSAGGTRVAPLPPAARRGLCALLAVGLAHREAAAALAAGGVTGPGDYYSWLATPRYSWECSSPGPQGAELEGGDSEDKGTLMVRSL